jgi:hypothetical protein
MGPYFKVKVISGSALVNIAHASVASQILNSLFVAGKHQLSIGSPWPEGRSRQVFARQVKSPANGISK